MGNNLKIAVVGMGGVGGYIGAKLAHKDCDITFIGRGKHFETVKLKGLKVNDNAVEFTVRPKLIDSADSEELLKHKFDVVFFTTKSYDLQSAFESVKNSIHKTTLLIPLCNGVSHKSEIESFFDTGIACEGCIYILSNIKEHGVIHKKAKTFNLLFGSDIEDEKFGILETVLNSCGLRSKYSKNIKLDCWKKYLFISSFASLTSYFKQPIGYVVKEEHELLQKVLQEIKSVANALNISLTDDDIQKVITQAQNVPYESKTSMLIDYENNHKTELETLCGYIVNEAENVGIEVPNMKMVYGSLLK